MANRDAGYWYQDRTGRYARRAAVALAVILSSIAAVSDPPFLREVPVWARMLYPLFMAALLAGYSQATRDVWSYAGAAAAAAVGCMDYSTRLYAYLSHRVAGLNEIAWGALFFLLAGADQFGQRRVAPCVVASETALMPSKGWFFHPLQLGFAQFLTRSSMAI